MSQYENTELIRDIYTKKITDFKSYDSLLMTHDYKRLSL